MTKGGGEVIQKMMDDKNSSFRCNIVQYILIKSIDGGRVTPCVQNVLKYLC